jgi:hypothetical protein
MTHQQRRKADELSRFLGTPTLSQGSEHLDIYCSCSRPTGVFVAFLSLLAIEALFQVFLLVLDSAHFFTSI